MTKRMTRANGKQAVLHLNWGGAGQPACGKTTQDGALVARRAGDVDCPRCLEIGAQSLPPSKPQPCAPCALGNMEAAARLLWHNVADGDQEEAARSIVNGAQVIAQTLKDAAALFDAFENGDGSPVAARAMSERIAALLKEAR